MQTTSMMILMSLCTGRLYTIFHLHVFELPFRTSRDLSLHSALKWKHSREILLNKVDEDLQRVKDNVEEQKANLNEVHLTMIAPTIHPVMVRRKNMFNFELPDWRIFFAGGFVVIVLLSIFFFLVYVKPWKH